MKGKAEENVDVLARALLRAHDEALCIDREPSREDYDVMAESTHHGRPVIEGWHAVARAAIVLGARTRSADPRVRLAELTGPDSTNFFGTGLSLREFMELHNAERVARSWALQSREEKRRRLNTVMRLSVELIRIREITQFSTGLAEQAIESVIEGDWKMVESWTEIFAFEDDCHDLAPIYATFRELLRQALRVGKEGVA
jgi:hypothetical protein